MGLNIDSARRYHLLTKYGIDIHEVEEMIRDQRGLCAICLTNEPNQVDHDHATGYVRGILCGGCNAGLGQFKESSQIIRRAIDYLNSHRPRDVHEPPTPYILSVA
ncbi:MAG TPA: endonuclease VII domain-containing protein [Actinomycetota bacterium]|nr:endonuclease VII domain-containing protein [Actinomycetota bacterium]